MSKGEGSWGLCFFFPQAFKEKCWIDHLRHDSSTNLDEIEKACKYMLNTFFV